MAAEDTQNNNRIVAIKILRNDLAQHVKQTIYGEVDIMKGLHHDNIVR